MKHFLIALATLALTLGFCLYTTISVRADMALTKSYLSEAVEQGRRKDFNGAAQSLRLAEEDWDRHSDFYGVVLSHAETDDILRAFASLREYARLGDQDDFLSGCAELARTVDHLREMELPLAKNVL
jgi:hypothetical protein